LKGKEEEDHMKDERVNVCWTDGSFLAKNSNIESITGNTNKDIYAF
jgi:hypothetical protein